jgi:hypothetical protein
MTNSTITYPAWPGEASPMDWYRLIHQAETIRSQWWLGLASVWGHINHGDYRLARAELDRVADDIEAGYWGAAPLSDRYGLRR